MNSSEESTEHSTSPTQRRVKCQDCGHTFMSRVENPRCSQCKSRDVEEISEGGEGGPEGGQWAPTRYHRILMNVVQDPSYNLPQDIINAVQRYSADYYNGKLPLSKLKEILKARDVQAKKAKAVIGEVNDALTRQLEDEDVIIEDLPPQRTKGEDQVDEIRKLREEMKKMNPKTKAKLEAEGKLYEELADRISQRQPLDKLAARVEKADEKYNILELVGIKLAESLGIDTSELKTSFMESFIGSKKGGKGEGEGGTGEKDLDELNPDEKAHEARKRVERRQRREEEEQEGEKEYNQIPSDV